MRPAPPIPPVDGADMLADLTLALPLGRHARLDDDEIEQAAEILEAHRL